MKIYCKKTEKTKQKLKKQTNRKTAVIADKTTNPESLKLLNIQFIIRSTEFQFIFNIKACKATLC